MGFSSIPSVTHYENVQEAKEEPYNLDRHISDLSTEYNVEEKLVRAIITCESNFKPDARNYEAKVGVDIGYWQLNSYYWEEAMEKMGWDIYNETENLEAGFWLLSNQGDKPWKWSKFCWSKIIS